ncbi:hypothetical protein FACS189472_04280 [Alphaproteobacteria bacterium]|nr:hypothetical protein FACS189472_04280 [Alphaproteobacteria bacterium]
MKENSEILSAWSTLLTLRLFRGCSRYVENQCFFVHSKIGERGRIFGVSKFDGTTTERKIRYLNYIDLKTKI